jgi:hypothetical protein
MVIEALAMYFDRLTYSAPAAQDFPVAHLSLRVETLGISSSVTQGLHAPCSQQPTAASQSRAPYQGQLVSSNDG